MKRFSSLVQRVLTVIALAMLLPMAAVYAAPAAAGGPALVIEHAISEEPLLGGHIAYTVTLRNSAPTPVADRGYNLSVTGTLPAGLRFVAAHPGPALVAVQSDGGTRVVWDDIADLEAGEALELSLRAELSIGLALATDFTTTVEAAFNTMPDNSGAWRTASAALTARVQAIDLEAEAEQSSSGHQVGGAGELPTAPGARPGADWPYRYRLTLRNNRAGATAGVSVTATLPPGVAYLGNPTITPNPTGASVSPALALQNDGALVLRWQLGALSPAQYDAPVVISFDAALPYAYRTAADRAADDGPFAGPMSGAPILEDTRLALAYEASGIYGGLSTADGVQSTPADDAPAAIIADYMTVRKGATPLVAGIGGEVAFTLTAYVSEYYPAGDVLLADVLPDGLSYIEGGASRPPLVVQPNTPGPGQTTLLWALDPAETGAGATATVTFKVKVDPVYAAAPYTGQPIVSADSFTNRVTLTGAWVDAVNSDRQGAASPDEATATITTPMPSFAKAVWRPDLNAWSSAAKGFTGDTLRFRLTYASAADVDARAVVIRDFLPRGMHYVSGSAVQATAGSFTSGGECVSAPTAPVVASLGGLEYLEWRLCNAARGATWEATIEARLGDIPDVQPGWLVANFGKLTGRGTVAPAYSLRSSATVDYLAPELTLTKTASPATNLVGGSRVNYTITVVNGGRAPAYNLVVSDIVPADLLVAAGGSAAPTPSSYSVISGDPATGQGGVLTWTTVASLNPGATQTFRYSATVPNGLSAGAQMTNLASVAYNSRADGAGHQWAATTDPDDLNTDAETVYLRGVTLALSADPGNVKPGDLVSWTVTGSVPAGVVAYWPVVQANSLPQGFAYLRTTEISGAAFDPDQARHPRNPFADGQREVRWFLSTIDNTAGGSAATFTIRFETLFTGYKPGSPATKYYTNNAVRASATASLYAGWYDTAAGYQASGGAFDGFDTNKTTRRSPRAQASATVVQPTLVLAASAERPVVGAGEELTLQLQVQNQGFSPAYDVDLSEVLPAGLSFVTTRSASVALPPGWSGPMPQTAEANSEGATTVRYSLDVLPNGGAWTMLLAVRVDAGIAADLKLNAVGSVTRYSSQPGTPGDVDADGVADERVYVGTTAAVQLATPASALAKAVAVADELTYGSALRYTLTIPAAPINATLYDVTLSDPVDPRLAVTGVSAGAMSGGNLAVSLGTIPPGQQRSLTIDAQLPEASPARDGDALPNQASYTTANSPRRVSNPVASTIVAPALTVAAAADRAEVRAGDRVSYQVSVANVGGGRAEGLTLAVALPSNAAFVAGSARLDGVPLADPAGGVWSLPVLPGSASLTVVFEAEFAAVEAGVAYPATFSAAGRDSRSQLIPADNAARVAADDDPQDRVTAAVYGPLAWSTDRTLVAFEDLKKYNWSDWDYNDFLLRITVRRGTLGSGDLAAVELRYEALARGAGFLNHAFLHQLPLTGGGWYAVSVAGADGSAVRAERTGFRGDDPTVAIFTSTRAALPQPSASMEQTNTRREQQGVIAGQWAVLTVVLSDPSANPLAALQPLPWDPYLRVVETGQEIHLVQPGHLDNTQTVTGRFDGTSPLIGYDLPLAHTFPDTWRWPQEFAGIWRGYPAYVQQVQSGGAAMAGWSVASLAREEWLWAGTIPAPDLAALAAVEDAPESRYFAPPVAADLTSDGRPELIVGNLLAGRVEVYDTARRPLPGWPREVGGGVRAAVAVADLDGDGRPEVLAGAADGKLYAWHADGSAVTGWPVSVGVEPGVSYRLLATPAVGDLNGDGKAEVVVPLSDGRLYAFDAGGAPRPGWPVSIGELPDAYDSQVLNSSPRIADLDRDGRPEVVVGSTNGSVYSFGGDGSTRWVFATGDMVIATPAVADINPGRSGLEVAVGSGDGYVYLLGADGVRLWRRGTGWTVRASPVAADVDGDGNLEIVAGSDDDKVWIWHSDGSRLGGWPQVAGADIFGAPAVGDIDGDGDLEVVAASDDAHVYAWHADGRVVGGWPRATSHSVKGGPALANLDADTALEVAATDMSGTLYLWGGVERTYLPALRR